MLALAPLAYAAVGVQRVAEMLHARRTGGRLAAAGARLVHDDGMGLLVAVHVLWFAAGLAEAWWAGEALGWWTVAGLGLFAAGGVLRYTAMASLGWRWNTRVWVLPHAPLVTGGPYRFLRHPIYAGVALELAGLPLAFGLWRTAAALSLVHLAAILRRIGKEEEALGLRQQGGTAAEASRRP